MVGSDCQPHLQNRRRSQRPSCCRPLHPYCRAPIPQTDRFYNSELPQRTYDPEQAKFYAKKAGLDPMAVTLSASDAAFSGAVDAAAVFRTAATGAGG